MTNILAFIPEFVFCKEMFDNFYAASLINVFCKIIWRESAACDLLEFVVGELFEFVTEFSRKIFPPSSEKASDESCCKFAEKFLPAV